MTRREANKLLSYYCPFIKEQFKKHFKRHLGKWKEGDLLEIDVVLKKILNKTLKEIQGEGTCEA